MVVGLPSRSRELRSTAGARFACDLEICFLPIWRDRGDGEAARETRSPVAKGWLRPAVGLSIRMAGSSNERNTRERFAFSVSGDEGELVGPAGKLDDLPPSRLPCIGGLNRRSRRLETSQGSGRLRPNCERVPLARPIYRPPGCRSFSPARTDVELVVPSLLARGEEGSYAAIRPVASPWERDVARRVFSRRFGSSPSLVGGAFFLSIERNTESARLPISTLDARPGLPAARWRGNPELEATPKNS